MCSFFQIMSGKKPVLHINSICKDYIIVFNEKFLSQQRLIYRVKISMNTCHSFLQNKNNGKVCRTGDTVWPFQSFQEFSVDFRVRIQLEFSTSELLQGQVNREKKMSHLCSWRNSISENVLKLSVWELIQFANACPHILLCCHYLYLHFFSIIIQSLSSLWIRYFFIFSY